MRRLHRSALLPYPSADVFALIDDVERYPDFLPWCAAAEVQSRTETEVVAELTVKRGGVSTSFTTRNDREPPARIGLTLLDGPFDAFDGAWCFHELGNGAGCKVELELEFKAAGSMVQRALASMLGYAIDTMVDAFCARADALYGNR